MGNSYWKASGLPLTQERLKEFLDYDPNTGMFMWRAPRPGRKPKPEFGAGEKPRASGGRVISVDGVNYTTAQLAWFYVKGEWPKGAIGHKNGNRHDDRITNLIDTNEIYISLPSKSALTVERLREIASYDPSTGIFTWKHRPGRTGGAARDGVPFGNHFRGGYVRAYINGKAYSHHRLAWLYMTGKWPSLDIDHINGVKDDNRWENLREATRQQNARNRSAFKGRKTKCIYQNKDGSWTAKITLSLGRYPTPEAAQEAYMAAAKLHFGEFARGP